MTYIEAVTDIKGQNDLYQSRDRYRRLSDVGFIFVTNYECNFSFDHFKHCIIAIGNLLFSGKEHQN